MYKSIKKAQKDSNIDEKTVTFSEDKNKSFATKISNPDIDAKPNKSILKIEQVIIKH